MNLVGVKGPLNRVFQEIYEIHTDKVRNKSKTEERVSRRRPKKGTSKNRED